jgi:hypothetical protein
LMRKRLARERKCRWPIRPADRGAPSGGGLDCIAWSPDIEVRNEAQRFHVLHRLVGRAVFAKADRVVGARFGLCNEQVTP